MRFSCLDLEVVVPPASKVPFFLGRQSLLSHLSPSDCLGTPPSLEAFVLQGDEREAFTWKIYAGGSGMIIICFQESLPSLRPKRAFERLSVEWWKGCLLHARVVLWWKLPNFCMPRCMCGDLPLWVLLLSPSLLGSWPVISGFSAGWADSNCHFSAACLWRDEAGRV